MSINIEYYKTFYYVAKYNKISIAAEKLYISQPAVTQTIKKLEDMIGCILFSRNNKGMILTEEGKRLYEIILESIEILDNVEYKFKKFENLEEGAIKIRTGSNIAKMILYDAIERFGKDYPNIKIEIATGNLDKSIENVHNGEIDMVLTYLPYDAKYTNLQEIECAKKEYVFAMSKEYSIQNNVKIDKIEDLNNYSLIVPKKNSAVREIFDNQFKDKINNFHYEVAQEQMKKEFIKRNLGIGFLIKDEIKKELKSGEIIEIDIPEASTKGAIGIITLKTEMLKFATKKLIEYIK